MGEWHKHLRACIHAKGGHFEHLLWFKSPHMLMFRNKSMIYYDLWYATLKSIDYNVAMTFILNNNNNNNSVKHTKSIAVVDLLYFTRQCSDTFKVWWEIWYESCCKFTDESNIEGIFLIGQHFSKLRTNIEWHVFLWLTVYILNITCSGSNLAFIMWNIQQQQQQHVCWLISGWDNSSPYLQRIWANMASLLLWAGHCSGGLLPAKWQISTLVCWHGQ